MAENSYIERRIITGMVVSTSFIREIYHLYKPELFKVQAAQQIATWCIRHFRKHKVAPTTDIQLIYSSYLRRKLLEQDQAEDIEEILQSLSDDFEEEDFNVDVLLDETIAYFDERNILLLTEEARDTALRGDGKEAHVILSRLKPAERQSTGDCDFFADDIERTRRVFENVPEPIIEYPGKLGQLLNRHMVRGGFVGFLGQEKVGKTWTLMDIAFQAQLGRRRVAFFAAGDMNREEMELRKYIYMSKRSNEFEYCQEMIIPVVDCWWNQNGECKEAPGCAPFHDEEKPKKWEASKYFEALDVFDDHVPCKECIGTPRFRGAPWFKTKEAVEPLDWKAAYNRERKYVKKIIRGSRWQFMDKPADTLTPRMIDNQLEIWHNQGFDADVILVDYPDIMDVDEEDRRFDFRHRENSKWKKLRAMAHRWHALVIAPTQADAFAYNKLWLDLTNYSEDKRKFSHTTAFFGLNQTDEEAELGLFRINQMLVRSGKRGKKFATVLQRLEMGRPHLGSF